MKANRSTRLRCVATSTQASARHSASAGFATVFPAPHAGDRTGARSSNTPRRGGSRVRLSAPLTWQRWTPRPGASPAGSGSGQQRRCFLRLFSPVLLLLVIFFSTDCRFFPSQKFQLGEEEEVLKFSTNHRTVPSRRVRCLARPIAVTPR